MHNFDLGAVLADAQRKEALTDWGPGEFEQPLTVLLDDYPGAGLNAIGEHILRSGIVHSLRMRLRAQEWMRRHPEILDETIAAPIVVVGHDAQRHHAAATAAGHRPAPALRLRLGGGRGRTQAGLRLRRETTRASRSARRARRRSRELATELFAIHPMYAREAEEEIVFLADAFLSHIPESGAHLPGYRSWLDAQDFAPAYRWLRRMLQLPPVAETAARTDRTRWVLKSPAHLGYLDALLAEFPDAHVVHMHRDPRITIASGASLNTTLWRMHADNVDPHRVGAQWLERMGGTNDRAMAARDDWADGAAESPTCTMTTRWPIRSGRWPGCTTPSGCR